MKRAVTFTLFLTVMTSLVAVTHGYLYWRLALPWGGEVARAAGWSLLAMAVYTPFGMASSRLIAGPVGTALSLVAYVWLGLLMLLLTGTVVGEVLRVGLAVSGTSQAVGARTLALGAIAWGVLAAGYGIVSARRSVAVVRRKVHLAQFPAELSGFKLVQLTDLHIGPTLRREWLERVVAKVNELEPDVVAITGDLVDGSVRRLRSEVAPLAKLNARHGVFFVTGNHEYYSGADAWCEELGRLGVKALRNERVVIGGEAGFDLAGVDDWDAFGPGHGRDLAGALAGRDANRAVVLLAHQPRQVHEAAERGVALQLSGHTHGGQIFPWNYAVRLQQPYVAGLVRHGDTQLYISRGTGYWGPPMRVFAPAEITVVELEPN